MHQVEITIPLGRRPAPAPPTARTLRLAARLAPAAAALICSALLAGGAGATDRCVVADNGAGTAKLPANCVSGHHSPGDVLFILDGLAAGDRILGKIKLHDIVVTNEVPGGSLGGTHQAWTAMIEVEMTGVGGLATYHRFVILPVSLGESDAAPRTPGAPLQSFDTDLFQLFAALPPGDPDFDLLRIFAGSDFSMPSPGHTTLTLTPDGNWAVDSFFDITYRIDFIGAPGGPFAGRSGSTTAGCNAQAGAPHPMRCNVPDIGSLTADFPPSCGDGYRSPPQQTVCQNGLPTGTSITGTLRLTDLATSSESPGGRLGGHEQSFAGLATFDLKGNGDLHGYQRTVSLHLTGNSQTGPRGGGAAVQGFPTELLVLQGQLPPGDPDFDLLRITAGTSLGMPSPGHTTLTRQPGGNWAVDSFFDITYRIDFIGAPGSMLAGYSGSDIAQAWFEEGAAEPKPRCEVPDNGGTATFPAQCADGFTGPPDALVALNGLPSGEPILGTIGLIGLTTISETPGGTLRGTTQQFDCRITVDLHGTGSLAGFSRQFTIPASGSSQCGPRGGGATPQDFPNELLALQGLVVGDPDFDLLRITAGSDFGMPSPGHTTFSLTPGGNWAVDSFFDIEYRIDFIGAPGGPLAGRSGSTQAENRFRACDLNSVSAVGDRVATVLRVGPAVPNPASSGSHVAFELPVAARVDAAVFDVSGRRVATIEGREFAAGRHELRWDGRDGAGQRARAGLYFLRVEAAGGRAERRIAVAR